MCCVAPGCMKVLVCSSWDQQCWPILGCAQVLFVDHWHNMILHLAWVFNEAMFLQKIKLDSSVKNDEFSEFKTCRRLFFLPAFSVLSFPAELSKCLSYGWCEGVFQVNVHVLVLGGARLVSAQSCCFPGILWCCFLGGVRQECFCWPFSFCIRSCSGWLGNQK